MSDFVFREMFPLGEGDTPYRKLTGDLVSTAQFEGERMVKVQREALTLLAAEAMVDCQHLLRPGHLAQLRKILDDPEASDNDRFVAFDLLKNANIAAGKVLPMCQDTGTSIVMAKKGERVWTGGGDAGALAAGIRKTFTETNLRYSQVAPLSMYEEVNTGDNLPAQIDLYADEGDEYHFLFVSKGGGSANKTFLYQQTKAVLNPKSLIKFVDEKIRTLGTSACPPYHLAIVIGGTSAELTLKTVKLASCRYLDTLPSTGNKYGQAFRDHDFEAEVLALTRQMGIGAQFGGKYFCHDVRVIRLPRHGASAPIGIGVSCSADRQILGKITAEGVFLEELESNPAKYLPDVDAAKLGGAVVRDRSHASDGRDPPHPLAVSHQDAAFPDGDADRGPRQRAREAAGAHRTRRGPTRVCQAAPDLLRRSRQDTEGLRLRLLWPHHRGPNGLLRRQAHGRGRQFRHPRQRQSRRRGARGLPQARRFLPRLDRRPRRPTGAGLHPQGRGARISRARHGGDLAHRSRELPRLHRHR